MWTAIRDIRYGAECGDHTYFIQPVQHLDSGLPVNTRVGDADTILEPRGA